MSEAPTLGEKIPLSVVRKENNVAETNKNDAGDAVQSAKDSANHTIQELAEQLKALREQVETLQAAGSQMASKAGKAVASGARIAGQKVAEEAHVAGDKAVAGAKYAGQKVSATVEAYPFSAILVGSAIAFLIGRATANVPAQHSYAETTLDGLRHRLNDLTNRLPPNVKSALRSSLR